MDHLPIRIITCIDTSITSMDSRDNNILGGCLESLGMFMEEEKIAL